VTSALLIENLVKRFTTGKAAVDGVSFDVPAGEIVVLLGPSGCGKTTTLQMIAGFVEPSGGAIRLEGRTAILGREQTDAKWFFRFPRIQPARPESRNPNTCLVPVLRRQIAGRPRAIG